MTDVCRNYANTMPFYVWDLCMYRFQPLKLNSGWILRPEGVRGAGYLALAEAIILECSVVLALLTFMLHEI